ncbi:MAG: sialidase family protein [Pseudomonadota bacterium]
MNKNLFLLLLPLATALTGHPAWGADSAHAGHGSTGQKSIPVDREKMWQSALARAPLSASATFDAKGRLWLATVKDGAVWVSHSENRGKNFSTPVRVNITPEHVAAEGENRPKIIAAANGHVYVSWTQSLTQPFSGHVRFSRSLDEGRTFSVPITVNTDRQAISHRFESMTIDPQGRIHLVWLDKREQSMAQAKSEAYIGNAVYHAVSKNGGASFDAERKIADHSCECCRTALAVDSDGTPVVFWRHIFGKNIRDHAMLRVDGKSSLTQVSRDGWEVEGCPHHGPALAIGSDGIYHFAWFTDAARQPGLFYSRSKDQGQSFSLPMHFGNVEAQAAHPYVLGLNERVYLVWKEFDGAKATIRALISRNRGASWSAPQTIATTASASDHPLLIGDGNKVYLSWNTGQEGFRLVEITEPAEAP